jgi:rhodanese-related sulfurtransferase
MSLTLNPDTSPPEAKKLLESGSIRLVDVREPSEFASGHLPSAHLVPLGTIEEVARSWDRQQPVLVYCQAGRRGEKARETLSRLGFAQVTNLVGGISAWTAAGLATEKSPGAPWSLERQVRFAVGLFVILFTSLGLWVHPGFFALNFFIAAGLIFSAVTNTCGMAIVLTKMPWNRRS